MCLPFRGLGFKGLGGSRVFKRFLRRCSILAMDLTVIWVLFASPTRFLM